MGNMKEVALVREPDHVTSIRAARKVKGRLPHLQALALAMHYRHPDGLTDTELRTLLTAAHGERPESTYRKRRSDLTALGYIAEAKIKRDNGRGSQEKVWVITEEGRRIALGLNQ